MNPPGNCIRGLSHRWGPSSGWCLNGCGWRDDGKSQYRGVPDGTPEPVEMVDITEPRHGRG